MPTGKSKTLFMTMFDTNVREQAISGVHAGQVVDVRWAHHAHAALALASRPRLHFLELGCLTSDVLQATRAHGEIAASHKRSRQAWQDGCGPCMFIALQARTPLMAGGSGRGCKTCPTHAGFWHSPAPSKLIRPSRPSPGAWDIWYTSFFSTATGSSKPWARSDDSLGFGCMAMPEWTGLRDSGASHQGGSGARSCMCATHWHS